MRRYPRLKAPPPSAGLLVSAERLSAGSSMPQNSPDQNTTFQSRFMLTTVMP
jgi:hypothetical protein